jgi:hypothetical protein
VITKTGRLTRLEDIGHACELNFFAVIEHLEQPDPPLTLQDLAAPYDYRARKFLDAVTKTGQTAAKAPPLALKAPLCAGSPRIVVRHEGWQQAAAVLILRPPASRLGGARALVVEHKPHVEVSPKVLVDPAAPFGHPLKRGSRVTLIGAVSRAQAFEDPDYVSNSRVSAC